MNKNGNSKFKFNNGYQLKYSVNQFTNKTTLLNTGLRTIKPLISDDPMHFNTGQTTIIDNVYSCEQVNYVDKPVAPNNAFKRVFFKLFKLS